MTDRRFSLLGWHPTAATATAAVVVAIGFGLCAISWGFLALVALGTFGPGILREFGLLRDEDEFQRRLAHRAGYHAYLGGGLATFLLLAYYRSGNHPLEDPAPLVSLILILSWFTWLLSSLLSYWGARKTASRLLYAFGAVWLLFTILSETGSEWQGPVGLFMQSLLVLPFFGLGFAARRWPRIAGLSLLAISAFLFYFFRLYRIIGSDPLGQGRAVVLVLFIGPLVASGVALVRADERA